MLKSVNKMIVKVVCFLSFSYHPSDMFEAVELRSFSNIRRTTKLDRQEGDSTDVNNYLSRWLMFVSNVNGGNAPFH